MEASEKLRVVIFAFSTAAILITVVLPVWASSAREQYELAAQCSKDAARVFKENGGKIGIADGVLTNFKNHYNVRMNKCFMVITQSSFPHSGNPGLNSKFLIDVNQNDTVGEFDELIQPSFKKMVVGCHVLGSLCHPLSEKAWDALAKPFMEQ